MFSLLPTWQIFPRLSAMCTVADAIEKKQPLTKQRLLGVSVAQSRLLGILHGTRFANHRDFDLARVFQTFLDFLGNIAG